MNTVLWIITYVIAILVGIYIGSSIEKWVHTPDSPEINPGNVTVEEMQSDLAVLYTYLDKYILQELHNFTTKDFTFDETCDIKVLPANSYRTLIKCLLSPKQVITVELLDGTKQTNTLFMMFINKIYLNYVSETPKHIKDILYKYYSGYTKNEYFINKKKRPNPSALPFITDYVRSYIWCRFEENDNAEHEITNIIRAGGTAMDADSVETAFKNYDSACCRKLTSNIYHSNDIGQEDDTPLGKTNFDEAKASTKPKDVSRFAYKFATNNLQPTVNSEQK